MIVVDVGCEVWKPWKGPYEASSEGRVRHAGTGTIWNPRQPSRPRDYLTLNIYLEGNRRRVAVHTIVLEAFVGPRPLGEEARHLNDDKFDNRAANLVWGTRGENARDASHNRRLHTGERASWSRLTEAQVREILSATETQQVLADRFGVARTTISSIRQRKNWGWLA